MARYQKPAPLNLTADDVWAAACQAQRLNGTYVKEGQTSELNPNVICKTNRQIVMSLMADITQITDEDREQGKLVRQFYQGYTFKILKGIKLSEFDNTAMLLDGADHYISIICYVEDFLATDKGTLGTTAAVIVAEVVE